MRANPHKIQIPCIDGWADLKSTEDGKTYKTDVFPTRGEALAELADIRAGIADFDGRVVPIDTPADGDLY